VRTEIFIAMNIKTGIARCDALYYQTTRRHIPEGRSFNILHSRNIKSYIVKLTTQDLSI
jgi:hypothetical protein